MRAYVTEVAAHARKTRRLEEALLAIAFELGGEAGARLAHKLGLLVETWSATVQRMGGAEIRSRNRQK